MAFVTISRFTSKQLLGAQQPSLKLFRIPAVSASSAVIQDSLQKDNESHEEKNLRLNRPMSPHLTIYKFGMSGTLSITHRITGIALSGYTIAIAGAALCPVDFNTICASIEALHPGTLTILTGKFILAFPLMYHTCNGVRHLMWDAGKQLNKKAVVTTGTTMLAASIITTLLVIFL